MRYRIRVTPEERQQLCLTRVNPNMDCIRETRGKEIWEIDGSRMDMLIRKLKKSELRTHLETVKRMGPMDSPYEADCPECGGEGGSHINNCNAVN